METKELRPGNLVKSGKGIYKIFALSQPQILAIQKHDEPYGSQENIFSCDNTIIKPIKITNKWLKNLKDWNFIDYGKRIVLNHMRYSAIKIELCSDKTAIYFHDNLINYKDYIHELQNLFYSLTKDELMFRSQDEALVP